MAWLEEVNTHLVQTLRQNLTTLNTGGIRVPINVDYSHAEGESEDPISVQLPKVTVGLYDLLLDLSRLGVNHGTKIRTNINHATMELREPPNPYWLFYQISILTQFNKDLISLTSQMLSIFPPRNTILVKNLAGLDPVALYMELVNYDRPRNAQIQRIENEERLVRRFRTIFRYKITAELTKSEVEQAYRVLKVFIETN